MKKEMIKTLALLLFGAAALSSCSIENRGRHGRYDKDNHGRNDRDRGHHDDRDHHYNNY